MMLGFPPPLFFQICWRFVSPAIIFVSSWGSSLLLLPLGQVSSWEPTEREQEDSRPARAPPTALLWAREGWTVRRVHTQRGQAGPAFA